MLQLKYLEIAHLIKKISKINVRWCLNQKPGPYISPSSGLLKRCKNSIKDETIELFNSHINSINIRLNEIGKLTSNLLKK